MSAPRTQKNDWMNDLLANSGFLVSGHSTFSAQLSLGVDVVPVLRHARLYTSAYPDVIVLTLEHSSDPVRTLNGGAIKKSRAYQELANLFGNIPLLAFQQQRANYFVLDSGPQPTVLDDKMLQTWFGSINPAYLHNVGTAKLVNKSVNDMFVPWTGSYLARDASSTTSMQSCRRVPKTGAS